MEICLAIFILLILAGIFMLAGEPDMDARARNEAVEELFRQIREIERDERENGLRRLILPLAILAVILAIAIAVLL